MSTKIQQNVETRDPLTGLENYHRFLYVINEEISKAKQASEELSLVMVDIDYFKKINDQNGYEVGDEVLKIITRCLTDSIAGNGTVFRYGGDQFASILPATEKEQAFLLIEKVRQSFYKQYDIETENKKVKLKLTLSAGISSYPEDGNRVQEIIRKAEGAMHRAKTSGRNKICLSRIEKMVTKTSHYTQEQLERLAQLAHNEGVGEAVLLREALDDLLKKCKESKCLCCKEL